MSDYQMQSIESGQTIIGNTIYGVNDTFIDLHIQIEPEVYKDEPEEIPIYADVLYIFLENGKQAKGRNEIDKLVNVVINYIGDTNDSSYIHFIETLREMANHKKNNLQTILCRLFGFTYREITKMYGGNRETHNQIWLDALSKNKFLKAFRQNYDKKHIAKRKYSVMTSEKHL